MSQSYEQNPSRIPQSPDEALLEPAELIAGVVLSQSVSPVEISMTELQESRSDVRVAQLLQAAEAEGARVEREGRQRW